MDYYDPLTILIFALGAGFAPGIYWLVYFYKKDWYEPEPKWLVLKAFFWGMLCIIPAGFINDTLFSGPFITPVIVAPISEELFKFLVLFLFFYPKKEFNEPVDGIVYAAAVALGFASVENVFYIHRAFETGSQWWIAGLRAVLSVPAHALFTIMSGYALGIVKCSKIRNRRWMIPRGVFAAMAVHSMFNFLAIISVFLSLGLIVFMYLAWRNVKGKITYAEIKSPFKNRRFARKPPKHWEKLN